MDNHFWKIVTAAGLILAFLVFGMVLVIRFRIFEQGAIFLNALAPSTIQTQETQQTALFLTQATSRQADFSGLDKKSFERMQAGCFEGNDCIPSLDHPEFVSVRQAKFLSDDDLVVGVAFDGWETEDDPVKAYPVKILNLHEVVNDFVNETPVVVSYSPLTMSPRVYEELFGGKSVNFGVSGMVLNSNLVMYDRETDSLWNQFDGAALAGPKREEKLAPYPFPVQLMRWGDWAKKYPTTVVLSDDTGFHYNYDVNPYENYEKSSDVYYPLEHSDARLDPKNVVFGIVLGDKQKIYPEAELQKALPNGGDLTDQFAGIKLKLTYDKKMFAVIDVQTNEPVPFTISYYFAWEAFYPSSDIYQVPA